MKFFVLLAVSTLSLIACSSSGLVHKEGNTASAVQDKMQAESKSSGKSAPATAAKPVKCTYDTDCMVQNSCVNEKCKLTGNTCRFRSDCPSPRGTCIDKVCQFN